MKINKVFLGLFACAALSACSNDESGIAPNDDPKVFTGDEAYMTVRLADAGSNTRAGDGGFEYGVDEQAVTNAHFYFYDENGVFVVQGNAWNGGNPSGDPVGNIEFTSNTLVVLKGLTKKAYPKYMVTVLNKPQNFVHGTTLTEMKAALADNMSEGIFYDNSGTNYFAMSTTSFAGQAGLEDNYFVTEIKEENFSLEPITGTIANPVTIYVERLAAKVSLMLSQDLEAEKINGKDYYKIKATVAGDPNAGDDTAAENLYVELLGWKLNATAKKSRIVKNIDKDWLETDLGFIWNVPSFYRSYWGQSFNYGQSGYPTNASEAAASEYLNYVSLEDGIVEIGKSAYCPENTNTSDIVSANFPSAVTSILLKARICDKDGNALNLLRYNGLLFQQGTFLEYVLNILNSRNELNVWYATTDGSGTTYTQIGKDYVELVNVADGELQVVFTNPSSTTLYSKGAGDVFTEITDIDGLKTRLNTSLADVSAGAVGYSGGLMYYNIPIEHLNNADITNGVIPEAKYGVVRNHRYVVTINKLENMGKGIYDETEVIVPGEDVETYFVGANINILSWKIVNQGVDL